jgi:hypothetical protein
MYIPWSFRDIVFNCKGDGPYTQPRNKFSSFMEPELKHSQYPATGPFREPGESNQQPQNFSYSILI